MVRSGLMARIVQFGLAYSAAGFLQSVGFSFEAARRD
jgi:hypothetical protein